MKIEKRKALQAQIEEFQKMLHEEDLDYNISVQAVDIDGATDFSYDYDRNDWLSSFC